jgi:hypothetical protein
MPSALPAATGLLGRMASVLGGKLGGKDSASSSQDRIKRLGLSQRQQMLNRLWAVYRGMQYEHCKVDWNGKENVDDMASEVISTQGYIPPGFVDMGKQGSALPLKFRRPSAPYALIKVIVDRFTGLLFSENQHPEIKVDGDPLTEDWLRAVAEVTRIWQVFIQARAYGGGAGTAVVGFQFINGKPHIEVHDPRWMTPEFTEHGSTTLLSVEKRYMYPKELRDEATGRWETKSFWYRRIIDEQSDVLFEPAEVGNGEEPEWVEAKRVDHAFGFCPVVWVQNQPAQDSEDGDPDCPPAVYENARAIDALVSQANRAILANCDPQLVLTTKAEMASVALSGDQALRVPDGDAKFLEVQATGPKAAMEMAGELKNNCLEMASCVLEDPDNSSGAQKTATAVERNYQAMWAKTDVLREQYGTKGVVPLLEMMYRAAVALGQPKPIPQELPQEQPPEIAPVPVAGQEPGAELHGDVNPGSPETMGGQAAPSEELDGVVSQRPTTVRQSVVLPPHRDENGNETEREPGDGGTISLKWPGYTQPTLDDVTKAVTAAVAALAGGIADDETAIHFVSPYLKVEDKQDLVEKVRAHAAQQQTDLMAQMASANQPSAGMAHPPGALLPAAPPEG